MYMAKVLLEKEILISKGSNSGVAKVQSKELSPLIGARVKLVLRKVV